MKREPGIHITKSVFKEIYQEVYGVSPKDADISYFFELARGYATDHRSVLVKTKKSEKVISQRIGSSLGEANLLSDIIYATRVKMKHIGATKIKQSDNTWKFVKDLVPVVKEFCDRHDLPIREGFIKYVEIGLSLLSKAKRANYNYCAKWMLDHASWIEDEYLSSSQVKNDSDPEITRMIHDYYQSNILSMTGIREDYKSNHVIYSHFIRVREICDEMGLDPEVWIDAQFAALSFCNGIPKVEDLDSDKAKQRVINYVSQHDIKPKTKQISTSIWDSFKE